MLFEVYDINDIADTRLADQNRKFNISQNLFNASEYISAAAVSSTFAALAATTAAALAAREIDEEKQFNGFK